MNELLNQLEHEIYSRSLLLPLDILLVGATGVGKFNHKCWIFGNRVAKVGEGCDPENPDYFKLSCERLFSCP